MTVHETKPCVHFDVPDDVGPLTALSISWESPGGDGSPGVYDWQMTDGTVSVRGRASTYRKARREAKRTFRRVRRDHRKTARRGGSDG